jgi:hypothetical protein
MDGKNEILCQWSRKLISGERERERERERESERGREREREREKINNDNINEVGIVCNIVLFSLDNFKFALVRTECDAHFIK